MRIFFLAALSAYLLAAICSGLLFTANRKRHDRSVLVLALIGFCTHTISLLGIWLSQGVSALLRLQVELSIVAWALCLIYLVAHRRWHARALASFMFPAVTALLLASVLLPSGAGDLPPLLTAEEAAWLLPVHTLLLLFAYAAFFVLFATSVMYLLQERELKSKTFGRVFHRLPSLATVEQIGALAAAAGWGMLTCGILTGMLWSASLGRSLWHNDPKEILAGLTWLLYTALLFDRATRLWRGRRAAWIGIAGFALVLCTFLGARLLGGYHVFN